MTDHIRTKPHQRLAGLWRDAKGGVALIFALSATALVAFMGAGLDMSRAYVARQELSNVATMTCQYAARPAVLSTAYGNSNGIAAYKTQVNNFATQALSRQNFTLSQTVTSPFSYTSLGGTSSVTLASTVPTLFLPIVSISTLPVGVTVTCAAGQTQSNSGGSNVVLTESFENSACSGTCWSTFQSNGAQNAPSNTPANTFPSNTGYVGSGGTEWTIMGYCVEVDAVGLIKSTVADGTHSAELDCDNGSGSRGNSSISNKTYYTAGTYQIRYNYAGRVAYPNYDPIWICGTTAADLAWANDNNSVGAPADNVARSNQLNVYFDADNNGAPATHATLDGTQTLAGSNLIDECVHSLNWIQRSITITVSTPGYYWLSFAADGSNDSYGAQLDNIMVCRTSCSGSVNDNFPDTWTSTPLIYEDTFESPSLTGTIQTTQNLSASYGTTSTSGWPGEDSVGWAIGPYNQVAFIRGALASQGSQSLELDSSKISGQTTSKRSISRYFYLAPGYYRLDYDYISNAKFTGLNGTSCTAAPTLATALTAYTSIVSTAGTNRITNSGGLWPLDTNSIAVFMSQSLKASYPIGSSTQDGTTTYQNPDGSTSTTPAVAPDGLSLTAYNPAQVNPVLDYCNYSSSWVNRTTYIKIVKPGQYWLTFSAPGTADKLGGSIDDVMLTASASNYGTAPSGAVTIPTAGATVGGTVSYTGFTVLADPFAP